MKYRILKLLVYTDSIKKLITYLNYCLFPEKKTGKPLVINKVAGQTLSRSYGRCIAEFLNEESLVRLGLLDLSTCVGLRYG